MNAYINAHIDAHSLNPFEVAKPHAPSICEAATQPADSCLTYVEKSYHTTLSISYIDKNKSSKYSFGPIQVLIYIEYHSHQQTTCIYPSMRWPSLYIVCLGIFKGILLIPRTMKRCLPAWLASTLWRPKSFRRRSSPCIKYITLFSPDVKKRPPMQSREWTKKVLNIFHTI